MSNQPLISRIQAHAIRLLAAREYTRAEIHTRLLRWLQRTQYKAEQKNAKSASHMATHTQSKASTQPAISDAAVHLPTTIYDTKSNISNTPATIDSSTVSANTADYATAINQVLDKLETTGLLNDQRAAESFVRSQAARFGVARVQYALKNKGVDAELANQVLGDLQHSETTRAHQVWQKKYGTLPQTPKEYARQMRFLAYRGFATETIHKILRGNVEL